MKKLLSTLDKEKKILIFFVLFCIISILANWFWFPEYILFGLFVVIVVSILYGVYRAIINTIEDADKNAH